MLLIQISRHCSEQILARQWEVKGKRAKLRKESEGFFFFLDEVKWWRKRWVFRCRLKIVRDSAFRMGLGRSFHQPGTVNENVLEWFCASLWWHHEAMLARRSQISWGDVDYYKWVEVGGCWACGCSICKHQCIELDASCNQEPVQGEREVWHGPFWIRWRPAVLLHSESSVKVWLCMIEVQLGEHYSSPV